MSGIDGYCATRYTDGSVRVFDASGQAVHGSVGQTVFKGARAAKAAFVVVAEWINEDGSIGARVHAFCSRLDLAQASARTEQRYWEAARFFIWDVRDVPVSA